jgi:hypothetical protein
MGHCGEFGDARRARALDLVMFHIWAIAPNQLCTMAQNHAKFFLQKLAKFFKESVRLKSELI